VPVDRWFDAVRQPDDVVRDECAVDLSTGLDPVGTSSSAVPAPPSASTGALSFSDIVALVRSTRPDAGWLDDGLTGSVGTGEVRQVVIEGVDDPERARDVCDDVLAVLLTRTPPPVVEVRSTRASSSPPAGPRRAGSFPAPDRVLRVARPHGRGAQSWAVPSGGPPAVAE